jgi:hypothetical protein
MSHQIKSVSFGFYNETDGDIAQIDKYINVEFPVREIEISFDFAIEPAAAREDDLVAPVILRSPWGEAPSLTANGSFQSTIARYRFAEPRMLSGTHHFELIDHDSQITTATDSRLAFCINIIFHE